MSPNEAERRRVVVAGAPAVGKTTLLREECGRHFTDVAELLRQLLLQEPAWRRAREVVASIACEDVDACWPRPGIDALRYRTTATRAAAVERVLTRLVVDHLQKMPEAERPLVFEATPVAATLIVQMSMPGELVLVDVDEPIRVARIAARLAPERRSEAASIARFQRVAHNAAWHELRGFASYGWRVSDRTGEKR